MLAIKVSRESEVGVPAMAMGRDAARRQLTLKMGNEFNAFKRFEDGPDEGVSQAMKARRLRELSSVVFCSLREIGEKREYLVMLQTE